MNRKRRVFKKNPIGLAAGRGFAKAQGLE